MFIEIGGFDDWLLLWLNQFRSSQPPLDGFVRWLSTANILKFVPICLAICWLWFKGSAQQALNRRLLLACVSASVVALFLGRLLALTLPFRDRPFLNPDLHLIPPVEGVLRSWSSFPSDHAVLAFALATSIFRLSRTIGLWAFVHATVFISLPRIYLNLHYPSDLIGGALFGVAVICLTLRVPKRHVVADFLLNTERQRPAVFYVGGFLLLYEIGEMFESFRTLAGMTFHVLRQLLSA